MTKPKGPEALETQGQARDILARVRPAFREHVKPHTENGEGERLGGGSILNARWNHRLSRDLDVYVRLQTTATGERDCRRSPRLWKTRSMARRRFAKSLRSTMTVRGRSGPMSDGDSMSGNTTPQQNPQRNPLPPKPGASFQYLPIAWMLLLACRPGSLIACFWP